MPTLIPATSRTMAVFEIFAREQRDLSNSDVARLLSVADSSASDLLHTLHTLGYLMRTPKTRRFYPTGRLFETARQIAKNDPLTSLAQEAVEQLSEKTNETAFFGVMERTALKITAVQASRQPLRYIVEVGDRVSLHASSMGKSLLGLLPPKDLLATVQKINLQPLTPETVVDEKKLIAQVEQGRKRGWYEGHGEASEGVSGLAVSGWLGGLPVGISLGGPTERLKKHRDAYVEALQEVRSSLLAES
ncbi:Pectin degradation repressor protein KdgR [compost metagenome]